MHRVVIYGPIHPAGMQLLTGHPEIACAVLDEPSEAELVEALRDADALLIRTGRLPEAAIAAAARLRVVARHGVGFDNVPVAALTTRGIPLAVVDAVNATSVAEHTLFFMLALAKRGPVHDREVRRGRWSGRLDPAATELAGKSVLLLGFGRVAREVASRVLAFGARVLAHDPHVRAETMAAAGVEVASDWRTTLGAVDFVSLHLPRMPETEAIIGAAELRAMQPSAFLINTSRGGLVDEAALARALAEGWIAGAGIDTLQDEPPRKNHELLASDRILLSPHIAGLTRESAARLSEAAARNVLNGLFGQLDARLVVNAEVLQRVAGTAGTDHA